MPTPRGYTIEPVDLQTATDAEVKEIAQFRQELAVEERPEDPPTPLEVIEQWLRARPPVKMARDLSGARPAARALAGYGVAARNLKDTGERPYPLVESPSSPGIGGRVLVARSSLASWGRSRDRATTSRDLRDEGPPAVRRGASPMRSARSRASP